MKLQRALFGQNWARFPRWYQVWLICSVVVPPGVILGSLLVGAPLLVMGVVVVVVVVLDVLNMAALHLERTMRRRRYRIRPGDTCNLRISGGTPEVPLLDSAPYEVVGLNGTTATVRRWRSVDDHGHPDLDDPVTVARRDLVHPRQLVRARIDFDFDDEDSDR